MNFHSDNWIEKRLMEHYAEASLLKPQGVVIAVQGSQNYGLDYEGSDLDTRCLYVPHLNELILNKNNSSTTYILDNNEHIDFHTVKHYMDIILKQNINFLEILFSKYYIANSIYWEELRASAEDIAHYNPYKFIQACKGTAANKYYRLHVGTAATQAIVDKLGYSPKELCHILRIEEVMRRYIDGEPFADCLQTKQRELLIAIKLGMFKLETAEQFAEEKIKHIRAMADTMKETDSNRELRLYLIDLVIKMYEEQYRKELSND